MNTYIRQTFFELIRCALGTEENLSRKPLANEWTELFSECQKQSIAGVVFPVLDKLSKAGHKPPLSVLYEWIGLNEQIRRQNEKVNKDVADVVWELEMDGFECVLLKGQGNNLMYPDIFSRTSGDIDVWVKPRAESANFTDVIKYVKGRNGVAKAMYHHIDLGKYNGTEVEVHYRPAFLFRPKYNKRLQTWFYSHSGSTEMMDSGIRIPTAEFNVVFQLSHIYNHLLHQGIGLRQIIDYFYVLRSVDNRKFEAEDFSVTLKYLGMWEIAGAMMWIQSEILGLEERYLIAPKDERRGKIMLEEIMRGGNFGFYDNGNRKANSRLKKNVQRIKRDMRMVRYFPSESLWEPAFRAYHLIWRTRYNRTTK